MWPFEEGGSCQILVDAIAQAHVALSHDLHCAQWYRTSGHDGAEKFHVTSLQQLSNVWSSRMSQICAVTDHLSFLSGAFGNLSASLS